MRFIIAFCFLFFSASCFATVDRKEAVEVGGIKQWINIKGISDQHPILLFLHGGPGNSAMSYSYKFTNELQKHFLVVQWDQRETGKTKELNPSTKPLSLALMEADVVELINYLRKHFSKNKIYLMGHSWGGFLALRMAALHPELLEACFALSPMVNQLESERLSLAWMMDNAKMQRNQKAVDELSRVRVPFENGEQIYFHRNWLAYFSGNKALSKPYVEAWAAKWLALFNEASMMNFLVEAPEIRCPIYFFVGRKDYQTHFSIAEQYFLIVKAEKKELFWFNNSGHNLNLTEPKKLQGIVISLKRTDGRGLHRKTN